MLVRLKSALVHSSVNWFNCCICPVRMAWFAVVNNKGNIVNFNRFLLKKTVADIQAEGAAHALKRTLGPLNLMSLGVGAIIGAGIFVITGTASAEYAGPAIVLSFVLAGIASGLAGMCYAELASVLPVSGSAYTYAYATLGEFFAWVMGWLLILEYGMSASTVAVGWSGYIVSFLRDFGLVIPPAFTMAPGEITTLANGTIINGIFNVPAFLITAAVTGLLIVGVHESAKVNNYIVGVKLLVVLAFIGFGLFHIDVANWHPFIPENQGKFGHYGYTGVLAGSGVIFFAYIGFEAVSTAAQEAKNPQKDMPVGILGSLVICTVLYILVSGILTGVVPYQKLGVPDPIAVGVDAMHLPWFAMIVKIGAIMGLSSVMLVTMYGQTRVFYTMASDGLLPPVFAKVHERFRTPHINTMIVGLLLGLTAALTPINKLGELVSMGTLLAFAVVCFSVLYLRYKEPDLVRPFRCPGMPILPVSGILACLALVAATALKSPDTIKLLGIYLVIGLFVYFFYSQHRSKLYLRHNSA